VTTGEDWFGRLYAESYRGLLLTAYALLEDVGEAEAVTRDALAVGYERRVRLAAEESPLEWVRAEVVRRARGRQRWRALPHRPPVIDREAEAVRLHRLAGLPPAAIASTVDLPVAAVVAAVAEAGPVSWASVRQPVVDRVLARSAQRRTRTRMLAVAAVAVVMLAVAVPLLRVGSGPSAATTPPATAPTLPSASPGLSPGDRRFVYDVRFADDRHGYALRASCTSSDCDLELLVSVDSARWVSRPVRKPRTEAGAMGQLVVLGPDEVAVDWYPQSPLSGEVYRVHSTDRGRTWERVSTEQRRSVAEIPAGGSLQEPCYGRGGRCDDQETLSVVVPGTAESASLPSAPRLRQVIPGRVPLEDGRWWITGIVPGTLQWAVGVSDDNGRTWTVSRLVPSRKNVSDVWSVVAYGDDLYAYGMGEASSGEWAMMAIFHSADGGRSWRRTSGQVPFQTTGSLVAAADGTLLTGTEVGDTRISRDHGHTFTTTDEQYPGYAYWAGTGYVIVPSPSKPIVYSPDGLHWRELRLRS
jgi:DNA-directed RNA polymerase specialized sigma24 family protein